MDAALALDRRHGPRGAPRRADLLQVALRLRDRAVLVDSLDDGRLRGDQVRERRDHVARRRPVLPARAHARQPARRGGHRRRLGRVPGHGLRDVDRLRRPRVPLLRALLLARGPRAPLEGAPGRRTRDRRPSPAATSSARSSSRASLVALRDRGRRPLAHRAHDRASCGATGRAATRSARSPWWSAHSSSSTASSCSTSTSGRYTTQYYEEPHGRPGPRRRALVRDRARRAAGDRRPHLAPAPRAPRRPHLPRLSSPGRRRRSGHSRSTPPSRPRTSRRSSRRSGRSATSSTSRPLLILGTVMVFESKRIDRRVVAGATAFVLVLFLFKAIQIGWPYYDAPGSSIAAVPRVPETLDDTRPPPRAPRVHSRSQSS